MTRNALGILLALGAQSEFPAGMPEIDSLRELARRIGVADDAAERDRLLMHEARHNSLTELPNRRHLHEIIDRRIVDHAGAPDAFAVIFIDLDRFKGVNDALGHDSGDELLRNAAQRILACIPPDSDAVLARLGGDEFIVVAGAEDQRGGPTGLADRIIAAFVDPFIIGGLHVHVGATIGVARFPEHGTTRDALLRNADLAMFSAKKAGRGLCVTFQETMSKKAVEQFVLEKDLRAALNTDEIHVAYQPRIELASGNFAGAEALARWTHPKLGSIPPAVFIAMAEETGIIDSLGAIILSKACHQLAEWRRNGLRIPRVSVNISARQFHARDLVQLLRGTVAEAGLRADDLELEITESALVDDIAAARSILERLRAAGFLISMDDFGTGYSSLSYLRTLPIQVLKIDRSFLVDVETDRRSRALVEAIIAMAHALDIRVVAEGIESAPHLRMLRSFGCDEGQGYLFARPMPAAQIERFVPQRAATVEETELEPQASS